MILMAVVKLIDIKGAKKLWEQDKRDFITLAVALIATLMLGVFVSVVALFSRRPPYVLVADLFQIGVIVAMSFSLVLFLAVTTQPKVGHVWRATTLVFRAPLVHL